MKMIAFNFALNKFLPYILIAFLSFYSIGLQRIESYVILGLAIFIGHFSFKTGYAVCYCEKNNIDLDRVDLDD
tara:strand:+ start:943 stop:1161 length:219 start_codon:yes stop_codon:yes gene_type:complete